MHEAAGWRDAVSRATARVGVAHSERATLRVGDVFLKVDADQARVEVEVEVEPRFRAPVPTPEVLWRKTPVLATAALPGTTLCCPVSHHQTVSLPALLRFTGDGPVAGPPFTARMWLESTAAPESPADHPRAENRLLGQMLPADPGNARVLLSTR